MDPEISEETFQMIFSKCIGGMEMYYEKQKHLVELLKDHAPANRKVTVNPPSPYEGTDNSSPNGETSPEVCTSGYNSANLSPEISEFPVYQLGSNLTMNPLWQLTKQKEEIAQAALKQEESSPNNESSPVEESKPSGVDHKNENSSNESESTETLSQTLKESPKSDMEETKSKKDEVEQEIEVIKDEKVEEGMKSEVKSEETRQNSENKPTETINTKTSEKEQLEWKKKVLLQKIFGKSVSGKNNLSQSKAEIDQEHENTPVKTPDNKKPKTTDSNPKKADKPKVGNSKKCSIPCEKTGSASKPTKTTPKTTTGMSTSSNHTNTLAEEPSECKSNVILPKSNGKPILLKISKTQSKEKCKGRTENAPEKTLSKKMPKEKEIDPKKIKSPENESNGKNTGIPSGKSPNINKICNKMEKGKLNQAMTQLEKGVSDVNTSSRSEQKAKKSDEKHSASKRKRESSPTHKSQPSKQERVSTGQTENPSKKPNISSSTPKHTAKKSEEKYRESKKERDRSPINKSQTSKEERVSTGKTEKPPKIIKSPSSTSKHTAKKLEEKHCASKRERDCSPLNKSQSSKQERVSTGKTENQLEKTKIPSSTSKHTTKKSEEKHCASKRERDCSLTNKSQPSKEERVLTGKTENSPGKIKMSPNPITAKLEDERKKIAEKMSSCIKVGSFEKEMMKWQMEELDNLTKKMTKKEKRPPSASIQKGVK